MEISISEYNGTHALRIKTPTVEEQTPTHFVVLLDTSDSMNESAKLEHVKLCTSLMLKLLTPNDKLSLVTFGDNSRILLAAVPTDAAHLSMISETIMALNTEGCTNLSAGLASATEVLAMDSQLKPMLLLLTDGHANRGISNVLGLNTIMQKVHEQFPALGMSVIGYGTNHNAELLKSFADVTHGPYSIVEDLEGAALAMGEALGSALSCVAQNVEIQCKPGASVEGPYCSIGGKIYVGDLYGGTESLYLLKTDGPVLVKGCSVPSMTPFCIEAVVTQAGRQADVELTSLRYECSLLFSRISRWFDDEQLVPDIAAFKARLADPFLAGNSLQTMLLTEAASLDAALAAMRLGRSREIEAQITQHAAFTSTGRGASRPIQESMSVSQEDPTVVLSPMTSRAQRRVASLMQTMSQGGQ